MLLTPNLSLAVSLDEAQQMPLPSVSSPLSLFIIIVFLEAPFPSCLSTEFHESETSRNYRNNASFSIIHSSEDKDLASSFKKEFSSK